MSSVIEEKTMAAENEAEILLLLAAFYNFNPESSSIDAMKNVDVESIGDDEVRECFRKITGYANDTVAGEESDPVIELKRDWTKLFRGVSPAYGPKAPYEALYTGDKGTKLFSDLTQLYLDEGYCGYSELKNRQDYIGVELDFAGFLALLRVNALNAGDSAEFDRLSEVLESFVRGHVGSWFPQFYKEAQEHIGTDYYRGVLDLTAIMLRLT
ncbi:TorD/DmsD family molecular chaperone [Seleniivibrio woodruffii]|uniref:TorD/DmsD family molecular chaperone n=1 Tax=Seleniivibrio woodruffii TaxID=1078050 RepID=UPI00240A455F|nr:molecular chaperone TorD family protein [Seleniivibrio woodruffii]